MDTFSFVNGLLALLTVIADVAIILFIIWIIFFKEKYNLFPFLQKWGMLFSFIVSLASVLGSLFYSQVAGFAPCSLCWFQRIFMYPEVVLLGLALIKKDSHIVDYALSLAGIGLLISLYQNYLYYNIGGLNVICNFGGGEASCVKRYIFEFGYVTIPLMSLTAFVLIIILLCTLKLKNKQL